MSNAFRVEELDQKIVQITIDVPGQRVNTFGRAVLEELSGIIGDLEKRSDIRGLLLASGKPGQFIAGADLKEIGMLAYLTPEQAADSLSFGHALFSRISELPFPTVALIDGPSMGGGTELILSMDYRIASTSPKVQIGLPEVKIGIIPGWGGTQRMPRVIGVHHAIQMITSGDPANSTRAAELGLVFDAVPSEKLIPEGIRLIEHAQKTGEWKEIRHKKSLPIGLSENEKMFLFGMSEGFIMGKTKGQYPAPIVALHAIRDGVDLPLDEGLAVEREKSKAVMGSTISANLITIFFNDTRLKSDPGVEDKSIKPREIGRVGVLGAGLMGSGIATAHARSKIPTAMVDIKPEFVAKGLERAKDVVLGRIKAGKASPMDMADMLANLNAGCSHALFADCDVVVEAVTENEGLKKEIYGELKKAMKPGAILASNTSTISITRMAAAAPDPALFVGMHFFNPVDRMQLVEVIRGEKTSDETVATIVALSKRIKKTPIVVNDCAGFLVNRCLLPYMTEALVLLTEGASMDEIDKVAVKFGMPMGPIALQDLVGIDTSCFAGRVLVDAYKDRAVHSTLLEDMVAAGRLGTKTGSGFRKYGKKGKAEPDPEVESILSKHRTAEQRKFTPQEIEDRLFFPMLLEATRVVEEGIVREPGDVDMGMILGCGFPPFRGGVLRWCDTEGADKILARLEPYISLGKRFEPTSLLVKNAKQGERFYPAPKLA